MYCHIVTNQPVALSHFCGFICWLNAQRRERGMSRGGAGVGGWARREGSSESRACSTPGGSRLRDVPEA